MMAGNFTNTAANMCSAKGKLLTSEATNGCNDLTGTVLPDGTIIGQGITACRHHPSGVPRSRREGACQFLACGKRRSARDWSRRLQLQSVIPGKHNGYLFRARVDYNLSDKTSFFISYQYGQDAAPSQGNGAHIYWTPDNSIPYPGGGLISSSFSKSIAGHFTHIFSPTLTNEFIASWGFGNFPVGPPKASAAYKTTLGYPASYGTVFKTGSPLIPSYSSAGGLYVPGLFSAGHL